MPHEHQEHDHDRDDKQDDAHQKPQTKVGYPRRAGADAVFKKGSQKRAKEVAQLIGTVERHTSLLTNRLNANDVHADEVDHMKRAVETERTTLLTLIGGLASTDPLVVRAMEATDRLNVVIQRLEALRRAHQSKGATAHERATREGVDVITRVVKETPPGYCDLAPQESSPCELDHAARLRLRTRLTNSVTKARINYGHAVNALHLQTMLAPVPPSMGMEIGKMILGVLFGVLAKGAEFAIAKGVDKVAAKMTKETWMPDPVGIVKDGPGEDSIALAKAVGNKVVEKGLEKMKEAKPGISAEQLSTTAQMAVPVPADTVSFLAGMRTAPDAWADTIILNMDNLLDVDLAALVDALPLTSPEISQPAFEAKIKATVERFKAQVLAVDTAPGTNVRPIQIHWNGKTRHALAAPEKAPNKNMHGEWKHVPVKTGKWTFVRWLDDDMRGMAQARVEEEEGPWASTFMAMANDADFWDIKTLELLAQETAR